MKKYLLLFLLLFFIISLVQSIEAKSIGRELPGFNFKVEGGPSLGLLNLNLDDLNETLTNNEFAALSDNIFLFGGEGIAGRKLGNRYGIFRQSGSTVSRQSDKRAELDITFAGLLYEKGIYSRDGIDLSLGCMIGRGRMELALSSDKPNNFEGIVGEVGEGKHDSVLMEKSFAALMPRVKGQYALKNLVNIGVSAGYLLSHDLGGGWEIAGNSVSGGPLSRFGALNLSVKLSFGF